MNRTYIQHYKSLFTLGIPIVIGQVGVIILGFADTLMIGHHSTNELAAASFVNNMFTLAIIFATGFSYGLTPIVGSLFGRGETSVVGRMLKNSIFANVLLAVLLTFIMWVLYLNIIYFFNFHTITSFYPENLVNCTSIINKCNIDVKYTIIKTF